MLKRKLPRKRRNGLEIIEEALGAANEGASITEIVYKANLNFSRGKSYIDFLLSKGLLSVEERAGEKTIYATTVKGKEFLKSFHTLQESWDDFLDRFNRFSSRSKGRRLT